MIYNEKYNLYMDNDFVVYRYSKNLDKLIPCKIFIQPNGYVRCNFPISKHITLHRLIWETFKGEIPNGYEIDHINRNRQDNRLENLRCVTHKENMNNNNTIEHRIKTQTGKSHPHKIQSWSTFGKLFFEHYGITKKDNIKLYNREAKFYYKYGKCRWKI